MLHLPFDYIIESAVVTTTICQNLKNLLQNLQSKLISQPTCIFFRRSIICCSCWLPDALEIASTHCFSVWETPSCFSCFACSFAGIDLIESTRTMQSAKADVRNFAVTPSALYFERRVCKCYSTCCSIAYGSNCSSVLQQTAIGPESISKKSCSFAKDTKFVSLSWT